MNNDKLLFGERVLMERRRRGLSQTQLADIIGVSVSSVRNYENNISYPDMDKAVKIADALGVSLDRLLLDDKFAKSIGINHRIILAQNQTDCTF